MNKAALANYHCSDAEAPHTACYLFDPVLRMCKRSGAKRVLDLGCGNGAFCEVLNKEGYDVVGVDPGVEGIRIAREKRPSLNIQSASTYDDLTALGVFDAVISMEVVEHLFEPRLLPRAAASVLKPGGILIVTTPYHGYLKNLTLALIGKMDAHYSPLWDGGHIKFWSRRTLQTLLEEEGFSVQEFVGVGRTIFLWKSMIFCATKN